MSHHVPTVNIQDLVDWKESMPKSQKFSDYIRCMLPKYERMVFEWEQIGVKYFTFVSRTKATEETYQSFLDEYVTDDVMHDYSGEDVYWHTEMEYWFSHPDIVDDVWAGSVTMNLTKLGDESPPHSVTPSEAFLRFTKYHKLHRGKDSTLDGDAKVYELLTSLWTGNIILALGMMQINNVELVHGYPTVMHQEWLNKTINGPKGGPPIEQQVIRVFPMKRTKKNANARGLPISKVFRKGAVVGAHLRTYTEEKPLFGKYAGTFLIPQHARTGRKKGQVNKDYDIRMDE